MKLIYKITNTKNNKVYIGCSKRGVEKRYLEHLQNFHNESRDSHFYKSLRLEKIDEGDLTVDIIDYLSEQTLDSEMLKIESGWINYYRDMLDFRNVYNVQTLKEPAIINDNIITIDTEQYDDLIFFDFSLIEKPNKLKFCKLDEIFLIRIDEIFNKIIGDNSLYQGKTLYRIKEYNYIDMKDIVFHPLCNLNIFKNLDKSKIKSMILYEYLQNNSNFKKSKEPFSIYCYDSEILINKNKNSNIIPYNGTLNKLKVCTDINYDKLLYMLKDTIKSVGNTFYESMKDLIFIIENFRNYVKNQLSKGTDMMIQNENKIKEDSSLIKESSDELIEKIYKLGKLSDSIEESLHCTREIALDISMEIITKGEDKLFDIIREKLM